jgi:hypothetical protein
LKASSGTSPCFSVGWRLLQIAQIVHETQRKMTNTTPSLLVKHLEWANPFLGIVVIAAKKDPLKSFLESCDPSSGLNPSTYVKM